MKTFVGIDRSPASIARAQEQAKALGLTNVQFECLDLDHKTPPGPFQEILATHALVQAEQDSAFLVAVGRPSSVPTTFSNKRTLNGEQGSVPDSIACALTSLQRDA
jgi:Predicted S-adenosylmethionine-dependent methyltransferase